MYKVDPEDAAYVSQFAWHLDCKGYVVSTRRPYRGARMHRLVAERMGLNIQGLLVDHINGVKADNRRENLRVATNGQNRANSKINSNSKSGSKGVHLKKKQKRNSNRKLRCDAKGGRWVAQINIDGKKHHLGNFDTCEKAHAAYKEAAEKAFGCFASTEGSPVCTQGLAQ